nr:MAG TPA: hypothetical protein [Caudoviricetes sp.]
MQLPNYYHILLPNHYNYQCRKKQHFPTHNSTNKNSPGEPDGSSGLLLCMAVFGWVAYFPCAFSLS